VSRPADTVAGAADLVVSTGRWSVIVVVPF
jgi:hypothetical protein